MARTPVSKAISTTYSIADKTAGALFTWATTEHFGLADRLANIPVTGFFGILFHIAIVLCSTLIGIVVAAALYYVGIAYGIPWLLELLFTA